MGPKRLLCLGYNNASVSTLTHGNVLDAYFSMPIIKSNVLCLSNVVSLSLSLSLISSNNHPPTQLRSWVGSSPIQWKIRSGTSTGAAALDLGIRFVHCRLVKLKFTEMASASVEDCKCLLFKSVNENSISKFPL
jgi:hypothetical protein